MSNAKTRKHRDWKNLQDSFVKFEGCQYSIVQNAAVKYGVIIGDLWGYISDVNEAIVKMYGAKDKSEFIGKHVLNFVIKEDRGRAVKESLDIIAAGQGKTEKFRVLSKSGEKIPVEVTIDFLRDKQGEKIGFIDIVRNTSGREKNEQYLKEK